MPITAKKMIKKLKKNGFEIVSQNGSHVKLINRLTNRTVIVPYHCKDLKRGLELAILKQAGIEEDNNE
ncbi:MAG: type II toxin-antitoxin system HicA family toxin [Clostridia bacterium]|nr:type II toxin-antitoxin system HicA family toxin [Clostridia bacterium]